MHTRTDGNTLLLSEDHDKLLIKKIDDCLAILNQKKITPKIALGVSITMSLLLLAAAAATFSYVWDVKAGKSRRIHGDMDAAEWRWRHEKLNRTYTSRDGRPLDHCGDLLGNEIDCYCRYDDYRDRSWERATPEVTAFWDACIPALDLLCNLAGELGITSKLLDAAMACCIGAIALVIVVEIMLINRIYQNSKNAINKLLLPDELKMLKQGCDELNIPIHDDQNMNSVITSLREFREHLLHPPAYEAFLVSPNQADAAKPIKISSSLMFSLFGRAPDTKNSVPPELPAPEPKMGSLNV